MNSSEYVSKEKAIASSIISAMNEAGFTKVNRPTRTLLECAIKLEKIRQQALDEAKTVCPVCEGSFSFLILPSAVRSWDKLHHRVSLIRDGMNRIIGQ